MLRLAVFPRNTTWTAASPGAIAIAIPSWVILRIDGSELDHRGIGPDGATPGPNCATISNCCVWSTLKVSVCGTMRIEMTCATGAVLELGSDVGAVAARNPHAVTHNIVVAAIPTTNTDNEAPITRERAVRSRIVTISSTLSLTNRRSSIQTDAISASILSRPICRAATSVLPTVRFSPATHVAFTCANSLTSIRANAVVVDGRRPCARR